MNKKGFTLVELLAVIIILSLLALITSTSITKIVKESRTDLYNNQLLAIQKAAESWGADNLDLLPDADECKYITLGALKNYGIIDNDINDPRTNQEFSDDLKIKITSSSSIYGSLVTLYEVNPNDITGCSNVYQSICTTSATSNIYDTGVEYTCNVNDSTTRNFYVMNTNNSYVTLILNENYDSDKPTWCSSSSSDNSCNANGLIAKLNQIKSDWSNINTIAIPSYEQIYNISNSTTLPSFMYTNLTDNDGYWLSTKGTTNTNAYYVSSSLIGEVAITSTTNGIRPIITLLKYQLTS